MLGQAVARQHERELLTIVVRVLRTLEYLACRILPLLVERILERRLMRLVVRRQRAVDQAAWSEEPAQPIGMQDERATAVERLHSGGAARRGIVRRLVRFEVRLVAERAPLLLVRIPPDVFLALRPRLAVGVGGCAVVEDAAVARPRPPPVVGDPVLLGVRRLARRLVHAVLVDPGMDP